MGNNDSLITLFRSVEATYKYRNAWGICRTYGACMHWRWEPFYQYKAPIVSDSSPLISLAILNKLDILDRIFDEVYIPNAVYEEITQQNKPHSKELKNFATNRVKQIQNQ